MEKHKKQKKKLMSHFYYRAAGSGGGEDDSGSRALTPARPRATMITERHSLFSILLAYTRICSGPRESPFLGILENLSNNRKEDRDIKEERKEDMRGRKKEKKRERRR